MDEYLGEGAVKAWLVIAAVFTAIGVLGLLADWDGLTRSAIIGSSTALTAGLVALAVNVARIVRR